MVRKIIRINEEKCVGCGLCVSACHEGAIGLVDGKAKLLREDYCDGLGNCLPACPTDAIVLEERETIPFNKVAAVANKENNQAEVVAGSCPGTRSNTIQQMNSCQKTEIASEQTSVGENQLNQWPVQIKLVPTNAPYFKQANLLVAADCAAYAYGNFHKEYMKNKITIIGCPKLDEGDYSEKLTAILRENDIKSVMVVRMEVPCCTGIENAVRNALQNCGKLIPWQIVNISTDGRILES